MPKNKLRNIKVGSNLSAKKAHDQLLEVLELISLPEDFVNDIRSKAEIMSNPTLYFLI